MGNGSLGAAQLPVAISEVEACDDECPKDRNQKISPRTDAEMKVVFSDKK
jgi:hypothetical protein